MSKELAEQLLAITDRHEIRKRISDPKVKIDQAFINHVCDVFNARRQAEEFDSAIASLALLFSAAEKVADFPLQAWALLQVGHIEYERRDFDRASDNIKRCIERCDRTSDARSMELKAHAYHLLGQIEHQQYADFDSALKHLKVAQELYSKLKKRGEVERIQQAIDDIQKQPPPNAPYKPLSQVLDEIILSRDTLDDLQAKIDEARRALTVLDTERTTIESHVNELHGISTSLTAYIDGLNEQVTHLQQEWEDLKRRTALLATSQDVPLWAAAVREDLKRGEISSFTLPLLEHLRMHGAPYAEAFIAEIRARNGLAPEALFDVSQYSDETRLFAGIANSFALEADNPHGAVEVLLEAWEIYLGIKDAVTQ